jgi:hypothetical protein
VTPAESVLHKMIEAGVIAEWFIVLTDEEAAVVERLTDDVAAIKAAAVTAHMSDVEIGVTWDEACEAMQAEQAER